MSDAQAEPKALKPAELDRRDRVALLFRAAEQAKLGSFLVLEGVNLPGIKRIARRLSRLLDPRHFAVLRLGRRGAFTASQAPLHRYWVRLPRYGDLVIHEQSYYHTLADQIRRGSLSRKDIARQIADINKFESSQTDNGYIVIKVYCDRPRKMLRNDYRSLGRNLKLILKKRMKKIVRGHDAYSNAYDELRGGTHTDRAPWFEPSPQGSRKDLETAVLDHVIAVLEKRLGIDSAAEVRDFDLAMERLRKKARGGA